MNVCVGESSGDAVCMSKPESLGDCNVVYGTQGESVLLCDARMIFAVRDTPLCQEASGCRHRKSVRKR